MGVCEHNREKKIKRSNCSVQTLGMRARVRERIQQKPLCMDTYSARSVHNMRSVLGMGVGVVVELGYNCRKVAVCVCVCAYNSAFTRYRPDTIYIYMPAPTLAQPTWELRVR